MGEGAERQRRLARIEPVVEPRHRAAARGARRRDHAGDRPRPRQVGAEDRAGRGIDQAGFRRGDDRRRQVVVAQAGGIGGEPVGRGGCGFGGNGGCSGALHRRSLCEGRHQSGSPSAVKRAGRGMAPACIARPVAPKVTRRRWTRREPTKTKMPGAKMPAKMILTGDVNLMNVTDPSVPFAQVADEFHRADVVFSQSRMLPRHSRRAFREQRRLLRRSQGRRGVAARRHPRGGHRQQRALRHEQHPLLDRAARRVRRRSTPAPARTSRRRGRR